MKKLIYRVVLKFDFELTRSVFVKAKNREAAERLALKRNPTAIKVDRSPFPQN